MREIERILWPYAIGFPRFLRIESPLFQLVGVLRLLREVVERIGLFNGCAFCGHWAFKIGGIPGQRHCVRRGQLDECRLACLASKGGNAAEPSLQSHLVQPQRVRDGIYAMLSGQLDRSLPYPAASSVAVGCCERHARFPETHGRRAQEMGPQDQLVYRFNKIYPY
jgi:hypothetical protein